MKMFQYNYNTSTFQIWAEGDEKLVMIGEGDYELARRIEFAIRDAELKMKNKMKKEFREELEELFRKLE